MEDVIEKSDDFDEHSIYIMGIFRGGGRGGRGPPNRKIFCSV